MQLIFKALFIAFGLSVLMVSTHAVIDIENGYYMTLEECIAMTLRQNQTIDNSYLDRITQKNALVNAEHAFNPQGTLTIGPSWTHAITPTSKAESGSANVSTAWTQALKTGGSLNFAWNKSTTLLGKEAKRSTYSDGFSLGFTQPLLKGGGFTMGTLSLTRAYLTEQGNVLSLKSTLMTNIQTAITRYRSYINQIESLKIQRRSFEREKIRLEQQEALVEAGRLAKNDLIKSRAAIASRELQLLEVENTTDDARIDLLRFMNMDTGIPLLPIIDLQVEEPQLPSLEDAMEIVYENDPSYQQALIALRNAELSLKEAKDGLLWDLGFTGSIASNGNAGRTWGLATYNAADMKRKTWSLGLNLVIPLNKRDRATSYLNAKIAMRKARIDFQNTLDNLKADVIKQMRTIENNYKRVQFAKENTRLNAEDLEVAEIRFNAGLITNFELVTTQDNYVTTENTELTAKITYLNNLVEFDRRLGTLLDTLQINIDEPAAQSKRIRAQSGMPPPST